MRALQRAQSASTLIFKTTNVCTVISKTPRVSIASSEPLGICCRWIKDVLVRKTRIESRSAERGMLLSSRCLLALYVMAPTSLAARYVEPTYAAMVFRVAAVYLGWSDFRPHSSAAKRPGRLTQPGRSFCVRALVIGTDWHRLG
jgi:hypothetical protein